MVRTALQNLSTIDSTWNQNPRIVHENLGCLLCHLTQKFNINNSEWNKIRRSTRVHSWDHNIHVIYGFSPYSSLNLHLSSWSPLAASLSPWEIVKHGVLFPGKYALCTTQSGQLYSPYGSIKSTTSKNCRFLLHCDCWLFHYQIEVDNYLV